jgi:hypothetical protein
LPLVVGEVKDPTVKQNLFCFLTCRFKDEIRATLIDDSGCSIDQVPLMLMRSDIEGNIARRPLYLF